MFKVQSFSKSKKNHRTFRAWKTLQHWNLPRGVKKRKGKDLVVLP